MLISKLYNLICYMLKMKFIKKELVNWFNIHGDNVIFLIFHLNFIFFLIVKLALLLLLKFYIIDALVLHWFL